MKKVTGIGGIFFKCNDTDGMRKWYETHLGLKTDAYGANIAWRDIDNPEKKAYTMLTPFAADTNYFKPSEKEFMINFRVDNLEELLKELTEQGVAIIGEMQVYDYGKFAHIIDLEGNKIELWEATDED